MFIKEPVVYHHNSYTDVSGVPACGTDVLSSRLQRQSFCPPTGRTGTVLPHP